MRRTFADPHDGLYVEYGMHPGPFPLRLGDASVGAARGDDIMTPMTSSELGVGCVCVLTAVLLLAAFLMATVQLCVCCVTNSASSSKSDTVVPLPLVRLHSR